MGGVTTWLTLRQAAQLAGCHPRTLLRRLRALEASDGRLRVLRSLGPAGRPCRKWWVAPSALRRLVDLRDAAGDADDVLARIVSRVQNVEKRQTALKSQIHALKRALARREPA